jgi:hypothetical protein
VKNSFSTRIRLVGLAIVIVMLLVLLLTGCANISKILSGCGGAPGSAEIPINLSGANDVGSLHIELVYDPAVIEVTDVKAGKLAQNAFLDSNIQTPGRVIIGIVNSNGIAGSGTVASIAFKSKAKTGTSTLTLENVVANSAEKLQDIRTKVSAGQYNAQSKKVDAPSISF